MKSSGQEAGGSDIRCFVVGDKVVASMMRQAKEGKLSKLKLLFCVIRNDSIAAAP